MVNITESDDFSSVLKSDLEKKLSPDVVLKFLSDLKDFIPPEKFSALNSILEANSEEKQSEKSSENLPLGKYRDNGDISPQNVLKNGFSAFREISKKQLLLMIKETVSKFGAPAYVASCGFYPLPSAKALSLVRYVNGSGNENSSVSAIEWNKTQMCHCRNVWLCPSCRSVIFAGRCIEINKAFRKWKSEGGYCCMMTLTASHTKTTQLSFMIPAMKSAYNKFRHSRIFRKFWNEIESPLGGASIVGNWEITFGKGGVHPHRHALFFVKGDALKYVDEFKKQWSKCCRDVGLFSSERHGLDFTVCKTEGEYLSKIGFELSSSSYSKECKDDFQRLNFPQLCFMAKNGIKWAEVQLRDYISSVKGLRALHWSKGLKERFGISDVSDEEVIQNRLKMYVAWISRKTALRLSTEVLCGLEDVFNMVRGHIEDENIKETCKALQIDLYSDEADLIYHYGNDTELDQKAVKTQFRLETEGRVYLNNIPDKLDHDFLEIPSGATAPPEIEKKSIEQGMFDF